MKHNTNWQDILLMLKLRGYSQERIARELGTTQSAVSDLASGKTVDPRYSTGRGLINMARRKR